MSIFNLFYLSYWFSQPGIIYGAAKWVWVGALLAFVIAGVVLKLAPALGNSAGLIRRLGNLFLGLGIFGLIWFFFRQEGVIFLAWRFWLIPWAAVLAWGLYKNIKYAVVRLPQIKAEQEARELKSKYLP